jgi:membrane-associated phospholipid phosphatase
MAIGFGLMPFDPVTGWFMVLSGLVVGLARIAAGVHYPLDVLAGLILSWPSAWLGLFLYHYFFK